MRKIFKKIFAIFIVLSFVGVYSQSAEEIIKQHFKENGGCENWDKLNSIYIKGTVQVGLGDEVEVEIFQKRPYFKKVVFLKEGKPILSEGYDGKKAYTYSEKLGKNIVVPIYTPEAFETDYFNYNKKGFKIERKKDKTIKGVSVYHIELTKNTVKDQLYFSKSDFSLVQEENEKEIIIYKKDKEFGGLRFSTEIEISPTNGVPYLLKIKEIKPNWGMKEDIFKF